MEEVLSLSTVSDTGCERMGVRCDIPEIPMIGPVDEAEPILKT